jgi:hypothetical protein
MDLSRLQVLKRRLVQDKNFLEVWSDFLDEFAMDPAFIDVGERIRHEGLEMAIAEIGLQLFPRDGNVTSTLLIRVPGHHFIHGNVNIAGRNGGVIYFEDIRVGLVAASDHFPSDETKAARFSTRDDRPSKKPSPN